MKELLGCLCSLFTVILILGFFGYKRKKSFERDFLAVLDDEAWKTPEQIRQLLRLTSGRDNVKNATIYVAGTSLEDEGRVEIGNTSKDASKNTIETFPTSGRICYRLKKADAHADCPEHCHHG